MGERVYLACAFIFAEGLVEAAEPCQMLGIPMMGRGIVGVQLDRSFEFSFRCLPIVIVVLYAQSQRGMSFREGVVQLQRALCRRACPGRILRRSAAVGIH